MLCVGWNVFYDEYSKPSERLVKLLIELMTSDKKKNKHLVIKIRVMACKFLFNICQPEISVIRRAEMSSIYNKDLATTKKFLFDFGAMEGKELIPQEYVQSIACGESGSASL